MDSKTNVVHKKDEGVQVTSREGMSRAEEDKKENDVPK